MTAHGFRPFAVGLGYAAPAPALLSGSMFDQSSTTKRCVNNSSFLEEDFANMLNVRAYDCSHAVRLYVVKRNI